MNPLLRALKIIVDWLEDGKIPYMVFGGLANSIYGNPRQTFDIDIKVVLPSEEDLGKFINDLGSIAVVLTEKPFRFIKDTNVLPVDIQDVRVDIVFAELPYEITAIQRSRVHDFFGFPIHVCRLEDFIIQKAVSEREQDWLDIETVMQNQGNLDWDYLLQHCRDLADLLDRPAILTRIKSFQDE